MIRKNGSLLPAVIALIASLVICGQIASILLQGRAVCLNNGCQVVEALTLISPLWFNLFGLAYFLTLTVVLFFTCMGEKKDVFLPSLLLLAGAGAEGALLSYQLFAVRTLCLYCSIVAGFVLLLNLLLGWRQIIRATSAIVAVVLASALLNFGPALLLSRVESIKAGVYAVRQGDEAAGRYHLFLSATCPHCQTVLTALERLPRCTVSINPISEATPDIAALNKLKVRQDFSPEANLLLLTLLDIKEIPVLLESSESHYTLYKGEKRILQILQAQCAPLPFASSDGQTYEGMSTPLDTQEDGECTIDAECPQ